MKGLTSAVCGASLIAFCLVAIISVAQVFPTVAPSRPATGARPGMTVLVDLAPLAVVAIKFPPGASVVRTRPGDA